jgi:hypothetical protein
VRQSEPDIRPLGGLAPALAVLSALFAVSYSLSPLAYLAAALAVPLRVMARGDESVRAIGTTAVIIAVVAGGRPWLAHRSSSSRQQWFPLCRSRSLPGGVRSSRAVTSGQRHFVIG